ncbi:MAG: hypothetical protein ABI843_05930 [Dokdonella sp.]
MRTVARWLTGCFALASLVPAVAIAGDGSIVLYVSMAIIGPGGSGDTCGTLDASSVTANVGDHLHICYIGQNNTSQTLTIHSLSNSVDGDVFPNFDLTIPPGQQQNLAELRVTVDTTLDISNTWVAQAVEGGTTWTSMVPSHIEALAPTLTLDRAAIEATAAVGTFTTQTLTLTDSGDGDLAWHFGEAAAPASAPGVFSEGAARRVIASRPTPSPVGTSSAVPAFAIEATPSGNRLVALDAADPATPTLLPGSLPASIAGGTFIDDDSSREYLLSDSDGLITVDTQTGAVATINPATTPQPGELGWRAMAWDPLNRVLLALSTDGVLPTLYTIDAQSGDASKVGDINDRVLTINGIYTALAVDSDGRIFAIDASNDLLVAVARDRYSLDGRVSGYTVGALGVDVEGSVGLAFDAAANTLYLSALDAGSGSSVMYTVDTVTGAASPVAPIGAGIDAYIALATVASARPCGVAGDVSWISLSRYIEAPLTPGDSASVDVITDATDLAEGSYDGYLCLHSTDAARRKTPIPVHFSVGAGAAQETSVFKDGFDGGAP